MKSGLAYPEGSGTALRVPNNVTQVPQPGPDPESKARSGIHGLPLPKNLNTNFLSPDFPDPRRHCLYSRFFS